MLPNPFMPTTKIGQNIAWCWPGVGRQSSDLQMNFSTNNFGPWANGKTDWITIPSGSERTMTPTTVAADLVARDLYWDGGNDGMYVEFVFYEQSQIGRWSDEDAYVIVNNRKAVFGNLSTKTDDDDGTRFESGLSNGIYW